jgi:hypothetical protein
MFINESIILCNYMTLEQRRNLFHAGIEAAFIPHDEQDCLETGVTQLVSAGDVNGLLTRANQLESVAPYMRTVACLAAYYGAFDTNTTRSLDDLSQNILAGELDARMDAVPGASYEGYTLQNSDSNALLQTIEQEFEVLRVLGDYVFQHARDKAPTLAPLYQTLGVHLTALAYSENISMNCFDAFVYSVCSGSHKATERWNDTKRRAVLSSMLANKHKDKPYTALALACVDAFSFDSAEPTSDTSQQSTSFRTRFDDLFGDDPLSFYRVVKTKGDKLRRLFEDLNSHSTDGRVLVPSPQYTEKRPYNRRELQGIICSSLIFAASAFATTASLGAVVYGVSTAVAGVGGALTARSYFCKKQQRERYNSLAEVVDYVDSFITERQPVHRQGRQRSTSRLVK